MGHPGLLVLAQVAEPARFHLLRQFDDRLGGLRIDAAQDDTVAAAAAAQQGLGIEVGGGGDHPSAVRIRSRTCR